ncbi:TPA: hypothetical protein ACKFTV_002206 [Klebsiella pneumoniae]
MINAQRLHRMYPNTFQVPTYEELSELKVGDLVKVCINNERFWSIITSIKGKTFIAEVNNHLVLNDLSVGDLIKIRFSNVFDYEFSR